jgi:hypothetical protein
MKKMLSGLYGTKKKGKKGKSRKRGKAFNPKALGLKLTTEKACLTGRKRRLKKGCTWGRGKYKGKIFKKVSR